MPTNPTLWSDLNQYSPTKQPLLYDTEDIIQSISNILCTREGSRFFNTSFGSPIGSLLHEPMNATTETRLENATVTALRRWEPRINIPTVRITADYENQRYDVLIVIEFLNRTGKTFEFKGQLDPKRFSEGIR